MPRAHVIRQQAEHFVSRNPELAYVIAEIVQERRTLQDGQLVAGLTPALRRMFDFLIDYEERYGISPSYSDMCSSLLVGRDSVARMLRMLKERGYISYVFNKARSITILPAARQFSRLDQARVAERLAA